MISTFGLIAKPKTDIQYTLLSPSILTLHFSVLMLTLWCCAGISMLLLVALNAKLQSSLHDKGVTALDGNTTSIQIRN